MVVVVVVVAVVFSNGEKKHLSMMMSLLWPFQKMMCPWVGEEKHSRGREN